MWVAVFVEGCLVGFVEGETKRETHTHTVFGGPNWTCPRVHADLPRPSCGPPQRHFFQ